MLVDIKDGEAEVRVKLLQEKLKAESPADVIRRALRILDYAVCGTSTGQVVCDSNQITFKAVTGDVAVLETW
jgi:hypothetical protein